MSENHAQFHGAWCPSITPFDQQGNIDLSALQQHLRRLEEAGTHVVLLMGSIGEFTALTLDERLMLIRETRKMSSLPLVANISATCMADMIRLAEEASHCEYQAVMILPHYYFQQTPAQLLAYYRDLGQRLNGKWFAYNFPARTGCDLDAVLVAQLAAEFPNFVGVKDTVDCLSHTRAIIQSVASVRDDFVVLSGYDEYLIPNLLAGGAGVISGLNNICPELFVRAIKAWDENDLTQLTGIQREISRLSAIYNIGNDFVTTIKTAVAHKFQYSGGGSRSFAGKLTCQESQQIDIMFSIK